MEYVLNLVKKDNPIIIEIGAADGEDSKQFLKNYKNITLHCFEPDPRAYITHKNNINDNRCKLYDYAISNNDGVANFHLSNKKNVNHEKLYRNDRKEMFRKATNTYKEIFDIDNNTKCGFGWFYSSSLSDINYKEASHSYTDYKVKTMKLDTFCLKNNIKSIDFLWTDVQGAEKELISGAKNILKNTRYILLEFGEVNEYINSMTEEQTINLMKNYSFEHIVKWENNLIFKNNKLEK